LTALTNAAINAQHPAIKRKRLKTSEVVLIDPSKKTELTTSTKKIIVPLLAVSKINFSEISFMAI
jgi:hypothetical protein